MKQFYLLFLAVHLTFGISNAMNVSSFGSDEYVKDDFLLFANSLNCYVNHNNSSITDFALSSTVNLTSFSCSPYSLPFNENFDTAVPPICWTQYPGSNSLGPNQQWEINATTHSGPGAAYLGWENVASGSLAEDWLVTPALDLTGSANNAMTFWTKDGFIGNQGSFYSVKVSTTSQTDRASFIDVVTFTETQLGNSYNQKTVNLSAYSGNIIYIAFVMANDDGDAWFLDDVSVYDSTVCTSPSQATGFNATAIDGGSGTATLSWTRGDGDNVLVVMRSGSAVNTDPSSGTTYMANAAFGSGDELGTGNFVVYNGPASSVDVGNLNYTFTYHVAVYEYMASDNCYNLSQLTGSFFVPCASFGLPFNEGFEGASFPPTCWSSYRGANGFGIFQDWQMTLDSYSGGKAAFVDFESDFNGATEDWLVTPAIILSSGADATLSFFTKDGDDSSDYGSIYTVRVSTTSPTDRTSFTTVTTYSEITLGSTYNQKTIDLSAYNDTTIYIAFVLAQDFGDSWFLDDVNVTGTPTAIDSNTEVYAASAPIGATTIIAENTTTPLTAEDALAFTIEDYATTDLLPTNVTTMRFVPGPNNTTDWTDAIQDVTLKDGNDVPITPSNVTITDSEIILAFNPGMVIPNGTSMDFTLGFYLHEVPITNGSIVQFQIDGVSSGFMADAIGSGFSEPLSGGTIVGNNITIDSGTLHISDTELNNLQIISVSNSRTLLIKGQITSKTNVELYDIKGRVVLSSSLDSTSITNHVNVDTLSDSIYVVILTNASQQITKKVIIK